jgi:hypothetical protein
MVEFALMCPSDAELADAQEALSRILELDDIGEIDLPPYLTRLLIELQEVLAVTRPARSERRSPTELSMTSRDMPRSLEPVGVTDVATRNGSREPEGTQDADGTVSGQPGLHAALTVERRRNHDRRR